ncbi:early nodulin-like protein 9 [Amaranthus tricolor]|uniref:early nodulin-like protein 9 n=1 Tax=Amaranthus tricolor TaxID=29722 RepID=UPI00258E3C1F|nr:early nodulin-like protein 9 [Amaranthus tricolor]
MEVKNYKFVNALRALIGVVSLVLLMNRGEATTFSVGGSKGWSVPSDNAPVFNEWAQKMRFQIGDSLLFKYPAATDSVLQVSKQDFDNCNTNLPIAKYTDGNTEFKLTKSGPYYFISGNKDNCNKNEKLVVIVMADRTANKNSPPSPLPSPTPLPSPPTITPSPAPTTSSDQQPPVASPPSDEGSTPAPSADSNPPKNNAAFYVLSFVGSIGAFVGSSLFLAF